MIYLTGTVVTPYRTIENGYVGINGKVISVVAEGKPAVGKDDSVHDCGGRLIFPGLFDKLMFGLVGYTTDRLNAEAVAGIVKAEVSFGVTNFNMCYGGTSTGTFFDFVSAAFEGMADLPEDAARIEGFGIEGPFINIETKGGVNPETIRDPDSALCRKMIESAKGNLREMTLSPELPGALDIIKVLVENGVVATIGHFHAPPEVIDSAIAAGVRNVCHFLNAFKPRERKYTGVIEPDVCDYMMIKDELYVEIISDGAHVHPTMMQVVDRIKSPDKIIAVTGSCAAAGMPDGIYEFDDGRRYIKKEGDANRMRSDTTMFMGSSLTMNRAAKNWRDLAGADYPKISRFASLNPARLFGLDHKIGSIEPGKNANIAVFDDEFECLLCLVEGKTVYKKG